MKKPNFFGTTFGWEGSVPISSFFFQNSENNAPDSSSSEHNRIQRRNNGLYRVCVCYFIPFFSTFYTCIRFNTRLGQVSTESEWNNTFSALTDLYHSTGGSISWKNSSGWTNNSMSVCDWYGVTCSEIETNPRKIMIL